MTILSTERLSISFGAVHAVDMLSLDIAPGIVFSIIGPNGAGKTTLFNMISGLYAPDDGRIRFAGEDVTGLAPDELARRGLSRTFQNLQIFFRMTAIENVAVQMRPDSRFRCLVTPLSVEAETDDFGSRLEAWVLGRQLRCSSDGWQTWTAYSHLVRVQSDGARETQAVRALLQLRVGERLAFMDQRSLVRRLVRLCIGPPSPAAAAAATRGPGTSAARSDDLQGSRPLRFGERNPGRRGDPRTR